jgi:hypothetical protein
VYNGKICRRFGRLDASCCLCMSTTPHAVLAMQAPAYSLLSLCEFILELTLCAAAAALPSSIACPAITLRFVEALLQAGRPATALAAQRARCAGGSSSSGGSSSLNEAEVLLRVQLGCGLLAEAFCDLRRHCTQVCVCVCVCG